MNKQPNSKLTISIKLTILIFTIFIVSNFIVTIIGFLLIKFGLYEKLILLSPFRLLFVLILISILTGITSNYLINKLTIMPIKQLIQATKEYAKGNFKERINISGTKEFDELNISFNKMAEELESVELLRNDFVNNFSHEFNTPITALNGYAKLLKQNKLEPSEKEEYLDIIIKESERLSTLSNNILLLNRIEHQKILSEHKKFRLDEQIRQTIMTFEKEITNKNIAIEIDLDDCIIDANYSMLSLVWRNLIDNAIKFLANNGKLDIELRAYSSACMVKISDNGIGIETNAIKHIFDKFYQADTSRTSKGNGLGLSLTKQIVDSHKGTIEVKSEIEKGSTFIVMLPLDII